MFVNVFDSVASVRRSASQRSSEYPEHAIGCPADRRRAAQVAGMKVHQDEHPGRLGLGEGVLERDPAIFAAECGEVFADTRPAGDRKSGVDGLGRDREAQAR